MRARVFLAHAFATLALGATAASCGRDFDPASNVNSLRVLGIQTSSPLARPGEKLTLEMLYYDGSPKQRERAVEIAWFGGCENPAGDVFYKCFDHLKAAMAPGGLPSGITVGTGRSFHIDVSADIISSRRETSGRTLPYGLVFVFYAVCGGSLVPRTAGDQSAPPIACVDPQGADVGDEDYVFGYLPIYVYDTIRSPNPIVTPGSFNGRNDAIETCDANEACSALPCHADADCKMGDHCGSTGACMPRVPHCAERRAGNCTKYDFAPVVDRKSASEDLIAESLDHKPTTEAVYVNYYATQGRMGQDTRRINDTNLGWTDDYGTTWIAPASAAGEARIFAVVRNNRGGVAWWFKDVYIELAR